MNAKWLYCKTNDKCLGVLVKTEVELNELKSIFNDRRHGKVQVLTLVAAKDMLKKAKANIKKEESIVESEPITVKKIEQTPFKKVIKKSVKKKIKK